VDWVVIKEVEIEGRVFKSLRAAVPSNDVAVSLLGQNALAQFQAIQISGDELKFVK
jgi:aspartyl protease family protein